MDEFPHIGKMFGIELEFFLIDKEGNVVNKAESIINSLKNKLNESEIKQECGHSMLELTSFPHLSPREVFGKFFSDFEQFLYELETNDLGLYFYGTYPGKNSNVMRDEKRYEIKSRILGKKEFLNAGRCIGFHCHYSLPQNAFNPNINFFYPDIKPQLKEKVKNLNNLYVALDPAISTLMQSSPYVEGKLLGKDGRLIIYRGEKAFNYKSSLYSKYPEFGRLDDYAKSYEELLEQISSRSSRWVGLLKGEGASLSDFAKEDASILDSSWNPVKISPHATIESRGADMNSLTHVVGLSRMLRILSKYVQNNSISIEPSKIGNSEPFKLEGEKLFVPEFGNLKNLEIKSATVGFEDDEVYDYSKALIGLVKKVTDIERQAPLRVFSKMLDDRRTVSDDIISFVKKTQGSTKKIEEETAHAFALKTSEKIYKDLLITKTMADENFIY